MHCLLSLLRPPPESTLFPYTTLFRSLRNLDPHAPNEAGEAPEQEDAGGPDAGVLGVVLGPDRRDQVGGVIGAEDADGVQPRSEEHTSELQSPYELVCRLPLEKKNMRS